MTLSFILSVDDLVAVNEHWLFSRRPELLPPGRLTNRLFMAVSIVCALLLAIPLGVWGYALGIVGCYSLLWVYSVLYRRLFVRSIRHLYAAIPSPGEVGLRTVVIAEDGLHFSTAVSTAVYRWRAIQAVAATDSHVFVYVGLVQALVIPRAQLPIQEVESFLREVQARSLRGNHEGAA